LNGGSHNSLSLTRQRFGAADDLEDFFVIEAWRALFICTVS